MPTNVVIDDYLINEALSLTKLKTKKESIKTAIEELIENRRRMDLRKIRDNINFKRITITKR